MDPGNSSNPNGDLGSEDRLVRLAWEYDERVIKGQLAPAAAAGCGLDSDSAQRLEEVQGTIELLSSIGPILAAMPAIGIEHSERSAVSSIALQQLSAIGFNGSNDLPQRLGRFEIKRELGRGGLGVVFLARDPVLNRDIALKLPRPEALLTPDLQYRFEREAQAAARLTHPSLVPVYEVGTIGPFKFIASAYCRGPALSSWLVRNPSQLSMRQTAVLIAKLADGMDYAHEQGVLHRDLKPGNVLCEPRTGGIEDRRGQVADTQLPFDPKITDFGLARITDVAADQTKTGLVMGTPGYMAPEQTEGRRDAIGPHTDVYGLGAILYELLTGRAPYRGDNDAETLRRMLSGELDSSHLRQADAPRDLEAICLKCLEVQPQRRYARAGQLAADLRRFLDRQPTEARPLGPMGRAARWMRRRPAVAALLLLSAFTIVSLFTGSVAYSIKISHANIIAETSRRDAVARGAELVQRQAQIEKQQEQLKRNLAVADLTLAATAYQRNNLLQARDLLARLVPSDQDHDVRGFTWHLLNQLCHHEHLVLRGHRGDVFTAVYSPDGTMLASCGIDRTVRLWSASDGSLLITFPPHEHELSQVAFSSTGRYLAASDHHGEVRIYDIDTTLKTSVPTITATLPQKSVVWGVAWSPVENVLGVATERGAEVLSLENEPVQSWPTGGSVRAVVFSRDGQRVFFAQDLYIYAGTIATGKRDKLSVDANERITALTLSHDGNLLVNAGGIQLNCWNTQNLELMPTSFTAGRRIDGICFSPDDRTLAVAGEDRKVELWDLSTKTPIETLLGHTGHVWSAEFSRDGKELATASTDGTIRLWKIAADNPRKLATRCKTAMSAMAFSVDSNHLAVGNVDGEVEIWDWKSGERTYRLHTPGTSVKTENLPQNFAGITALAYSPDGVQLAAGEAAGAVQLWDTATGQSQGQLLGLSLPATSVSYSPDGLQLAVGSMYEHARLWDLPNKRCRPASCALFEASQVCFLPGSQRLALRCMATNTLEMIDSERLNPCWQLSAPPNTNGLLAISADGRCLATGGGVLDPTVQLWSADTGAVLGSLIGHSSAVAAIAFSPDGQTLASGSDDGSVRLWDLDSRRELLVFNLGFERIMSLSFSPDSRALAVIGQTSEGGELWVWYSETPPKTLRRVQTRIAGNMDEPSSPSEKVFADARSIEQTALHREMRSYERLTSNVRTRYGKNSGLIYVTCEERCVDGVVEYGALEFSTYLERQASSPPEVSGLPAVMRWLNRPLESGDRQIAYLNVSSGTRDVNYRILDHDIAEWQLVLASEVGPTDDVLERFHHINRWAKVHGHAGGFPTFHDEVRSGHLYYGVALIKLGAAKELWIPIARQ